MDALSNDFASQRQLAIIERFEAFINYVYPIALNIRRSHHMVRDRLIGAMFDQVVLNRFVSSWKGHANWANSYNLFNRLGI